MPNIQYTAQKNSFTGEKVGEREREREVLLQGRKKRLNMINYYTN